MTDRIGPTFLVLLSIAFGGYGIGELVRACRTKVLEQWREKALLGAGGIILGAMLLVTLWSSGG